MLTQSLHSSSHYFHHQDDQVLRSFFDSAPMMMGILELWGNDLRHIAANKASAEYYNCSEEDIKGKLASETSAPKERIRFWVNKLKEAQQTKAPLHFEYCDYLNSDKWYSATVSMIESHSVDETPRFSYILQDISHNHRNEKKLQELVHERTAEIQAVFESVSDGVIVFDKNDNVILINPALARICGFAKPEELIANLKYISDNIELFYEDDTPLPPKLSPVALIRGGTVLKNYELKVRRKDTHQEWYFSFSGESVYNDRAERILIVCIARDITGTKLAQKNQKRIQKNLEEAVKSRDEFLSIASHELKTPLTSLKLQTQMEKRILARMESQAESPRMVKFLHRTDIQIQRLTHLVDDMLDISKISSGKLTLVRARVNLLSILQEVADKLSDLFRHAGCELVLKDAHSCTGMWDRFRIEQVMVNLLTNAAKYGPGRPIEVSIDCKDAEAILKIKDHGRGIATKDFDRIFNRFERAISANEVSGLGLGLYITHQIVKMHQGSIGVESRLKEGSTFTVTLPLLPEDDHE